MLFDAGREEIGAVSSSVLSSYCERHGYAFRLHRELIDPSRNAAWNKLPAVRQALEESDWAFWFDADVFVVDPERRLEEFVRDDVELVVSKDAYGLCTGFFGARSSAWTRQLLDTWWFLGSFRVDDESREHWDQNTLKALVRGFPEIDERVDAVPEDVVANPESARSEVKPLAFHYWAHCAPEGDIVRAFEDGWPYRSG
jgi:hypothetical protein